MKRSRGPLTRGPGVVIGVTGFVLALFFQNCDGGFQIDGTSGEISSLGSRTTGQFRITTFNTAGLVVPEGQSFEGGLEYKVVTSGQNISSATLMWSLPTNTGNCILKSGTGPETRYVQCDRSGTVSIQASAIWTDGSTSVISSQRTTAALIVDPCGSSTSTRTVFRIANGTGANAWNASTSPVVVNVGQTLRICNDDATSHQLRTAGTPCASQPAAMARGGFYDCVIANNTGTNATTGVFDGLYDQIAGVNAIFYVRPYDGVALYADTTKTASGQSCVSCHSTFANSTKRGASFTGIKAAIANNAGGMGTYNGRITDDEIRAIAFSLSQ